MFRTGSGEHGVRHPAILEEINHWTDAWCFDIQEYSQGRELRKFAMADASEEYLLFVRRCMQFHHIWTVYFDLLSGNYVPSHGHKQPEQVEVDWTLPSQMGPTLMFILYAFFYSLIEDSDDGLDAFRIWRVRFPDEFAAIDALERLIAPMRPDLKVFRNRLGFHGSRSQKHESKGFELFGNQSGTKMIEVMKAFKALNAALISKDLAREHNSTEEMAAARSRLDAIPKRCEQVSSVRLF